VLLASNYPACLQILACMAVTCQVHWAGCCLQECSSAHKSQMQADVRVTTVATADDGVGFDLHCMMHVLFDMQREHA